MLTPDSVVSYNCGLEIAHAAANNKRMVPIVAREVKADAVAEPLREAELAFYRDTDDFERKTDELTSALDTDLTGSTPIRVSLPVQLSGTQTAGITALFCAAKTPLG